MPKLIYFSTSGKWLEYELGDLTHIGRHPDQDLQLLDRMISKEHAEIERQGAQFVLRDVGSRNGTVLNDELVENPVILRDGDEISLGNHVLRFVDDPDPDPTQQNNSIIDFNELGGADKLFSNPDESSGNTQRDSSQNIIKSKVEIVKNSLDGGAFLPESQIASDSEVRRDYEKLRVGAELLLKAAAVFDIDKLLEIIIEKAFQLFRADRVGILLRDENGEMQPRIAVNRNGTPIGHFKISARLLTEVIEEKSAVLSADAMQDERFASSNSIVVDNVRSTMVVPLMYQDEVLGVINLDTQMMTGAFIEKDLQILTGFARQAALTIQQSKIVAEMRQNEIIRNNLRRIISSHLIDDVMSGKIELKKSGSRAEATVLFADIRGFSRMTEQTEPENIVSMLNDFFETMVDCVFRHDGAVDKFVGDEVMAVWGVNVAKDTHAQKAVQAAVDMMNAMKEFNQKREKRMLPPIAIGIGVATGIMIAGYMGSNQAMSYTVIGDTVNLGARLCAAAQGGEILVNADTWKHVKGDFNGMPLPPIMVKGKQEPVSVFRISR